MLPFYLHAFTRLHTATNRTHWRVAVRHQVALEAPGQALHKQVQQVQQLSEA